MTTTVQITFRDMDPSEALEAQIREKVDWLTHYCQEITRCHVTVEAPHRRHQQGTHFRVRVEVSVPGGELVAGRAPTEHAAHEDCHIALRDAFLAARREVTAHMRRKRIEVRRGA